MRIPSGKTDQLIFFVAVDSTDLVTRGTGLTTFTVYRSRNGGAATVYTTPTVAELSAANMPGVYSLTIDEDTTIASGSDSEEYCVHITQASMAPVTRTIELYRRDTTTGTTITVSAGAVNTVTTVTNQLTAAVIATSVWQDATAGDFTAASSIGKSLYIANVAPGAAGGHFISGSNAGTTTLGALTVTGATTLSGGISTTTIATSGTVTLNALTVSNATTLSGAVSLGSTLGVTGNVTFSGATGFTITNGIVANITGNLSGSVGSVTGAVGSVTGAVGSVTGAVGSVTGLTASNLDATVSSRLASASITLSGGIVSADVKKVNAVTVIGTGIAADLWRA